MIAKIMRGGDMRGLMRYLVGPGTHNEHTDPHLVAGSGGVMAWWDDAVLDREAANQIGSLLDKPRLVHGVDVSVNVKQWDEAEQSQKVVGRRAAHVWHCPLSLHAEEGEIGDERWAEIAHRFVELVGINDGARSEARWAAVHHGSSTGGNDHVHLVVGLVREDGTKVSTHRDFRRAQQACLQIEKEFGLRVTEGRASERSEPGLSRGELERASDTEPSRRWLERVVRGASTAARSEDEFVRRVRRAGALIRPRFQAGKQDEVVGYSVRKRGEGEIWVGGGNLAPDLTIAKLRTGWEISQDDAAVAEWQAAWRGMKPAKAGREVQEPTTQEWERAAAEMGAVAAQLRQVPLEDQATWTRVARQVSGVLSAWSTNLEVDPGPLAAAAKVVRRYATVKREPPADSGARVRLTSQAYLLAAVAVKSDSIGAQLAILQQLMNTMNALRDAQRAAGQMRTAQAVATAEKTHLTEWRKELRHSEMAGTPEGREALNAVRLTNMNAPAGARRQSPLPGTTTPADSTQRRRSEHTIEQGSSRE
ncbi:MAG: relaxase/mobilization nuclease domain-containing protein [Microbacteriaceae bacterium]